MHRAAQRIAIRWLHRQVNASDDEEMAELKHERGQVEYEARRHGGRNPFIEGVPGDYRIGVYDPEEGIRWWSGAYLLAPNTRRFEARVRRYPDQASAKREAKTNVVSHVRAVDPHLVVGWDKRIDRLWSTMW